MKRVTRLRSTVLALASVLLATFALSLSATVVDRQPLAGPRDELVEAPPARVVASGDMFLVHGQRVTTSGVNLDEGNPIRGAEGFAVTWSDGWLIVRPRDEDRTVSILHLGQDGTLEKFLDLPRIGEFNGAASNGGTLVLLEKAPEQLGQSLWMTVVDDERVVRRHQLTSRVEHARIESFGGGFLVITTVRSSPGGHLLHAWRLDGDGTPKQVEEIDHFQHEPYFNAGTNGERMLLATSALFEATIRVIGPALEATEPIVISDPIGSDLTRLVPLPLDSGFLVSYGFRTSGVTEERAMIVDENGRVVSDGPADPIAAGDRSGEHYLVLRPWGDAGLAEGDPRHVVAALPMRRRLYQPPQSIDAIVSEDVTLTSIEYLQAYHFQQPGAKIFVRFDETGRLIDETSEPFPGGFALATPEGFAFLSIEEGVIRMQRLARRGGWIDEEPVVIADAPGARVVAGDASDHDLLVAWATEDEIVWSRFELDGAPLQEAPFRRARGETRSLTTIGITRRDGARLVLVYDFDICRLSPCFVEDLFEALVLGETGEPLGPVRELDDVYSPSVHAVGLPDGTWVVPDLGLRGSLLHLAHDGSLMETVTHPRFENLSRLTPTPLGWKAFGSAPLRIIEFIGLDLPVRLTGLEGVSEPRFAAGDRLTFLGEAPGFEETSVPWSGRIETVEGDLSIRLFDVGWDRLERRIRVDVANEGTTVATGISVTASDYSVYFSPFREWVGTIASLQPGESASVSATVAAWAPSDLRFLVLASSIEDVDVEDNSAIITSAEPLPRRRSVGRKP